MLDTDKQLPIKTLSELSKLFNALLYFNAIVDGFHFAILPGAIRFRPVLSCKSNMPDQGELFAMDVICGGIMFSNCSIGSGLYILPYLKDITPSNVVPLLPPVELCGSW